VIHVSERFCLAAPIERPDKYAVKYEKMAEDFSMQFRSRLLPNQRPHGKSQSVYNLCGEFQSMPLRIMTKSDIPASMRLKEIAGWNQTAEDWMRFLEASERGCFVAEVDGDVRGTVTTISYEKRFAWVGMVLVDPEYRGRGLGTKLLKIAIEYLQEARIAAIKLDATPQGKPIYEKLGFQAEYEIERWILKRTAKAAAQSRETIQRNKVSEQNLEAILAEDREVFGADRSQLLKSLWQGAPEFTGAVWENSTLRGSAFGRRGSFADHLGPWMAKDKSAATGLLNSFIAQSRRETLVVDRLKSNAIAGDLLKTMGFEYSRPLMRMVRGVNQYPGRTESLCAITGPEFG
jgi:GNAT superfamily N-acetyltransferase